MPRCQLLLVIGALLHYSEGEQRAQRGDISHNGPGPEPVARRRDCRGQAANEALKGAQTVLVYNLGTSHHNEDDVEDARALQTGIQCALLSV